MISSERWDKRGRVFRMADADVMVQTSLCQAGLCVSIRVKRDGGQVEPGNSGFFDSVPNSPLAAVLSRICGRYNDNDLHPGMPEQEVYLAVNGMLDAGFDERRNFLMSRGYLDVPMAEVLVMDYTPPPNCAPGMFRYGCGHVFYPLKPTVVRDVMMMMDMSLPRESLEVLFAGRRYEPLAPGGA